MEKRIGCIDSTLAAYNNSQLRMCCIHFGKIKITMSIFFLNSPCHKKSVTGDRGHKPASAYCIEDSRGTDCPEKLYFYSRDKALKLHMRATPSYV
jgi:hypothetical protein